MKNSIVFVLILLLCLLGCTSKNNASSVPDRTGAVVAGGEVVVLSWKQEKDQIMYFLNGDSTGSDEVGFNRLVNSIETTASNGTIFLILNPQYVLPMEISALVFVYPFKNYASYSRLMKLANNSWVLTEGPMDQVVKAHIQHLPVQK